MLAGARDGMSSGLLALAGGWPAVIGLASLTTSDSPLPEEGLELPEQLYEFFADEVYRGLEPDIRNGLGLLATAPSLDRELAIELLGAERAERVCAEALTLGVLEERGGKLELHPLAAAFLEEHARREANTDFLEALGTASSSIATGESGMLPSISSIARGLAGLEAAHRRGARRSSEHGETSDAWNLGPTSRRAGALEPSIVLVARGEIDLRHGLHTSAQAIAMRASIGAGDDCDVLFRALELAARRLTSDRVKRRLSICTSARERRHPTRLAVVRRCGDE